MLLQFVIFATLASSYLLQGVDKVNGNPGDYVDMLKIFQVFFQIICFSKNYVTFNSKVPCDILISCSEEQNSILQPKKHVNHIVL